ncbi:MAG: hypothetical protein REH83_04025, partial [Rickettsiella sp.]|nr:hypothetical protein [Rickettsiella sp.]
YNLIMQYWPEYIAELKQRIQAVTDQQEELELQRHLKRVQETEVCVVVSPEQNEIKKFKKLSLDIEKHRNKMVDRNLEKEFKDPNHPFRLAIVCAMWITGFDVPCVSTVYLDKPLKGHTLMQTIARANRVYDAEKENGLIVDYGNVYKKLEEAYAVYGEADPTKQFKIAEESIDVLRLPIKNPQDLVEELKHIINTICLFLQDLAFDIDLLIRSHGIQRLSLIDNAINCICLNQKTRDTFDCSAREMIRKYKALYPEKIITLFMDRYTAIQKIYDSLKQRKQPADINEVIQRLQKEVDMSITLKPSLANDNAYVDLSKLDFKKLKQAFKKTTKKNTFVFDLKTVMGKNIEKMVQKNPLRLKFYDNYKKIIDEYNQGKELLSVQKAFDALQALMQNLSKVEAKVIAEGLDEETLVIFDLLKKPKLTKTEEAEVKKIAINILSTLKQEKLKVERWREKIQVKSQIKTLILDRLQWLPKAAFSNDEVKKYSEDVYQHIYSYYRNEHNGHL